MMLTARLFARQFGLTISRYCSSKVPHEPTWIELDKERIPKVPEISRELVEQLERLSLVEFGGDEGLACLNAAVTSASGLYMVNTDGVEPLDSVLEDSDKPQRTQMEADQPPRSYVTSRRYKLPLHPGVLYLRQDEVTDGKCRSAVLSNAVRTEEEYFVAPPGNIPLKTKDFDYKKKLT